MELKCLRMRKGLTQKDLSEITGISVVTIVKIEKGKHDSVKLRLLKKIAAALDSTVESLFLN